MRDDWKKSAEQTLRGTYCELWDRMFAQLRNPEYDNSMWLQSPSGYLLFADGVRLAVDPVLRLRWMHGELDSRIALSFVCVSHILITHDHDDHLDTKLAAALRTLPICWVLPDFIEPALLLDAGIAAGRIRRFTPGESFRLGGLDIRTFPSLHFSPDGTRGTKECGYRIRSSRRSLLFPGDIRDYDCTRMPEAEPADDLFAHVWLGVENSMNLPCEPYLTQFCDFMSAFRPKRVFLTHLYELGRSPEDMWTYAHAGLAADGLLARIPSLEIKVPRIGGRYAL